MGSKYPILKPSEVINKLEKIGFVFKSQKGSHLKYVFQDRVVIIPNHYEVAKGTLKSILEMANITIDEFMNI